MSKVITLADDLYIRAAEVAAKDKVSVDDFVSAAVGNYLAIRQYIKSRARSFDLDNFEKALGTIPDVEPDENDRP